MINAVGDNRHKTVRSDYGIQFEGARVVGRTEMDMYWPACLFDDG